MTNHKFIKFATKFWGKGSKLINFTKKVLENYKFAMGYAILNRLIGLVNKTLKMSFFQENFHFHNLSWVLDQWRPKKRTSLKEDSNWNDILKPCFTQLWMNELCRCLLNRPGYTSFVNYYVLKLSERT